METNNETPPRTASHDAPRAGGGRASTPSLLNGIYIPCPTPFDAHGEIDVAALQTNIKRWNETGVRGYVLLGSTGERVHLSEDERRRVSEAARTATAPDKTFIVGIGGGSTRESLREASEAWGVKADAVLALPPHYYTRQMTDDVLLEHFKTLADESPVPVILYHIPQNTHVKLSPQTVRSLAAHPNIIGIKDSSGDRAYLGDVLSSLSEDAPKDFAVTVGHATTLTHALRSGATGAILAVASVCPALCVEIYQHACAGKFDEAQARQAELDEIVHVLGGYGIGGIKAALDCLGFVGGQVRQPLRDTDHKARREIDEVFARLLGARR